MTLVNAANPPVSKLGADHGDLLGRAAFDRREQHRQIGHAAPAVGVDDG
jgi:hypothetical protein